MRPHPTCSTFFLITLAVGCLGSGLVMAEPKTTPANAAKQAEAILLSRNLARCRDLRQCGKALRKNPCACTDETFPCRLDKIQKTGCEIRFSCKELNIVVPGKYVRGPDVICENLPPTLLERLRAATNGHFRESHTPDLRLGC